MADSEAEVVAVDDQDVSARAAWAALAAIKREVDAAGCMVNGGHPVPAAIIEGVHLMRERLEELTGTDDDGEDDPIARQRGLVSVAYCADCEHDGLRQRCRRVRGAWWCPTHRDMGTVTFIRPALGGQDFDPDQAFVEWQRLQPSGHTEFFERNREAAERQAADTLAQADGLARAPPSK